MYYSLNNQYPVPKLPEKIRLSNSSTRTDPSTFTEEELLDSGWRSVSDPMPHDPNEHTLSWKEIDGTYNWILSPLSLEDKSNRVRLERNQRINDVMWRVHRHRREEALRLPPTDDIIKLYQYIQALADIPEQDGFPTSVIWPEEPREG